MDFADVSQIPIMTVNILYALPKTALHDRLTKVGRVIDESKLDGRDSNIEFLIPYDDVVARWKKVIGYVYGAKNLYARYAYNARHTFPNRAKPKNPLAQLNWRNIKRAAYSFTHIIWYCGVRSNYRKFFWEMFWTELKRGEIENIFQIALVAHHLIVYAQECLEGKLQASNYSSRAADDAEAAKKAEAAAQPQRQKAREHELAAV